MGRIKKSAKQLIILMKKPIAITFFLLFALLRAQDAAPETTDAAATDAADAGSDAGDAGDAAEEAPVEETAEAEAATEDGGEAEGEGAEAAEEGGDGDAASSDESLNSQINTTIQEIQTSLQGDGGDAEGVSLTEDNVASLVESLWPSVQNFVEQSLGEVSTLDEMNVDEITEEEAALIRSKFRVRAKRKNVF